MGLLGNIIRDFCLFSLVEGYIYCYFFEKIGGFKKFKWYEIFVLSVGNCFISQVFPPLIYQIMMILWMGIYLLKKRDIKFFKSVFYSLMVVSILLIIEMNICMMYELLLDIEFNKINKYILFVIMIPMRIIEVITINIINKRRN